MYQLIFTMIIMIAGWIIFYTNKQVSNKSKCVIPFINLTFWLLWLILNIYSYSASKQGLNAKAEFFFHNNTSMILPLIILPNIIVGTILPLVLIGGYSIYNVFKKNKENHKA